MKLSFTLAIMTGFVLGSYSAVMLLKKESEAVQELIDLGVSLANEVTLLEDENAIKNLQRSYGYYTDKKLWTQVADLFSENASVEFSQRGIVIGKDRIHTFLAVFSEEGIKGGILANHLQLQPVIDIAPSGVDAKGRWRVLQMNGVYQSSANWGGGIYENEYVKEGGVWKISKLRVYNSFYINYNPGWISNAYPHAGISEGFEPDLPSTEVYPIYPEVYVAPFHYANPVTGIQFRNR